LGSIFVIINLIYKQRMKLRYHIHTPSLIDSIRTPWFDEFENLVIPPRSFMFTTSFTFKKFHKLFPKNVSCLKIYNKGPSVFFPPTGFVKNETNKTFVVKLRTQSFKIYSNKPPFVSEYHGATHYH